MAQFKISDVPASSRSNVKDDDATFINLSEASLATLPGHLARFKAISEAIEEFRAPFEASLKKAGQVKPGQVVIVTKGKFGWVAVVGKPRAGNGAGINIEDVK